MVQNRRSGKRFSTLNSWKISRTGKKSAPAVAKRLLRLIDLTLEAPFTGIGKPEPLRFDRHGQWSRRLTRHDRIVYEVTNETIGFLSARFHYGSD